MGFKARIEKLEKKSFGQYPNIIIYDPKEKTAKQAYAEYEMRIGRAIRPGEYYRMVAAPTINKPPWSGTGRTE